MALAWPAAALASGWPAYLGGPTHTSASSETAITTTNAAGLTEAWHWSPPLATGSQPKAQLYGSPTVANGSVYIGSNTGVFFALQASRCARL